MPTENRNYPDRLCHIDYTAHPHRCGCLSGDDEAQRRFDEYQRDTKLAKSEDEVARLTAQRDALQERLNAADQRVDDLETQLASTEQSRRAWFDSSQAADKRIDGLTGTSSRAAADIVAERQRQITAEGYNPDRDDCYSFGELALAAAGYAASAGGARSIGRQLFRWDDVHWKPSTPRRDLVKSGALILAEIERIDRAAITNTPQ